MQIHAPHRNQQEKSEPDLESVKKQNRNYISLINRVSIQQSNDSLFH